MITVIACPKPFIGQQAIIQSRAIASWKEIATNVDVLIYSNDESTKRAASSLGVTCCAEFDKTVEGTPIFGSVIEDAERRCKFRQLLYLNSDILLSRTIAAAFATVGSKFDKYLIVGQRFNLKENYVPPTELLQRRDVTDLLSKSMVGEYGPLTAIDYFGFPKGQWTGLHQVIIGRAFYDGALLAYCLRSRIHIIDCTRVVNAIHQFHGYGHLAGGKLEVWQGREARSNRTLSRIFRNAPSLAEADLILTSRETLVRAPSRSALRNLEMLVRFRCNFPRLGLFITAFQKIINVLFKALLKRNLYSAIVNRRTADVFALDKIVDRCPRS